MSTSTSETGQVLAPPIAARPSMSRPIAGIRATNVSVLMLGIITSVVLNRTLGPDGKGLYATLLTTSQLIVMLASLGLGKSVTFHLANRGHKQQSVFGVFLCINLMAVILCLAFAIGLSLFSPRVEVYRRTGFFALGTLCIFSLIHASGMGVLRGLKQFGSSNRQSILTSVIFFAAIAVMACSGRTSPMTAVACQSFSFLAGLFWIWPKLKAFGFQFQPRFEPGLAKKM